MRRLISILIITGAVVTVAHAAVAELAVVPMNVASQTVRVSGFGSNTGDVVGGSSVGTSWNFGNEHGSTAGSITSELIDGELVITVTGALSKGSTPSIARVSVDLQPKFGFVVPNYGTPIFLQLTNVNSEFIGLVELGYLRFTPGIEEHFYGAYSSELLDGFASLGQFDSYLSEPSITFTSITLPLSALIPNDTIAFDWLIYQYLDLDVDNSTGTFSETYTVRAITYLPEPSASLTIPSGAAMVLALAKLRGTSLIH